MPAIFALEKTPEASIPNADPGEVNLFVDQADSIQKTKDESGVVRISDPSVSTDLLNGTATLTELDSDPEPTAAGQVLATSSVGAPTVGPHFAGFQDPRAAGISNSVRIINAVNDSGANTNAVIDELVLMDPGTFAADQTVTLPGVGAGQINREIWIKITGAVGGFKVSVVAAISTEIDGLANGDPDLDLTTDRQWMKLFGTGTGWLIVG